MTAPCPAPAPPPSVPPRPRPVDTPLLPHHFQALALVHGHGWLEQGTAEALAELQAAPLPPPPPPRLTLKEQRRQRRLERVRKALAMSPRAPRVKGPMLPLLASFGPRLRAAREAAGLNQEALGRPAGLYQAPVSAIENGRRSVRLGELVAFARVLEVEPAALYEGWEGAA